MDRCLIKSFFLHLVLAFRSQPVVLSLMALLLVCTQMPESARAGEFEYQECIRQLCTSYGKAEYDCVQSCLADLNGPAKTMPLPPVPVLYGAIAIEDKTLITGFSKGQSSRADAEREALAKCRSAGGSKSGCKIAVWGHNSCLALATSQAGSGGGNRWGYAWSDDGWVSRKEATAACRKDGGTNCKVAVTFCTG